MHILIHDIILNVKLGKTTGGDMLTKTGVTGKLLIGVTIYFLPSKNHQTNTWSNWRTR